MYRAEEKGAQVILQSASGISAIICPKIGNSLIHFGKTGKNVLHFPQKAEEYTKTNSLAGNPLLHPWANRMEGNYFWWNGSRYPMDSQAIPMRDAKFFPLHGLLYKSPKWYTTRVETNEAFAMHEAKLDFAVHNAYMTQFPFAHELVMRHWLEGNTITIELSIKNTGSREMPVCSGFHPYFSYAGHKREEVRLTLPVKERWITNDLLLPSGKKEEVDFTPEKPFPLSGKTFDDGYTGIIEGQPFVLETPSYKAEILFGDTFPNTVIYAPDHKEKPYVCIEPMAAPTNALQLDHYGMYKVQSIAPEKTWTGWFSITLR